MNSILNNLRIKNISIKDIRPYIKQAKLEGICFDIHNNYFGYFTGNDLCGFGGLRIFKNKVVFKSIYVNPLYRHQGIFRTILDYLIEIALNYSIIGEATCTKMSITEFRRRGFKPIKIYKNYVKVRHENLQQTKRF